MHLSRCLVVLSLLATALSAQVPKEAQGYWFLFNTLGYINIKADGSFVEQPGGATGKIKFMDESLASWTKGAASGGARLDDDTLILNTATDVVHFWIATLEYRRAEPDAQKSLIAVIDKLNKPAAAVAASATAAAGEVQGALQAQATKAISNIERRALEMKIRSNLRLLDSAARQYMLENGEAKVSFAKLMASENKPKGFAAVDGEDYSKLVFGEDGKALTVTSQNGVTASYTP